MSDKPVDIKAEGVDPYRYYIADPGFKEDKWVYSAQCLPSNPSVVHHIIVFVAPPETVDRIIEAQKRALAELSESQKKGENPQALRARRRAARLRGSREKGDGCQVARETSRIESGKGQIRQAREKRKSRRR